MKEFIFPSKFIWEKDSYKNHYGKLLVEPLERGFGVTLGNALRRVLLSSIPGIAITGLRIDGIQHEFSTIEGVKEDVVEIILNLKQIALKPVISDFPHTVKTEVSGKPEIYAEDLIQDNTVEVMNGNLHIATINSKKTLNIELDITRGFGYLPIEKVSVERKENPLGTIAIDGIYTPVRKVTFHVENTRVGQSVDYEKLILEIWTTGAISPKESVEFATSMLNQHLSLVEKGQKIGEEEVVEEKKQPKEEVELDIPISELRLSTRVCNALSSKDIHTLGELVKTPLEKFEEVKNLGKKSIEEIEEALKKRGYNLFSLTEFTDNIKEENEAQKKHKKVK